MYAVHHFHHQLLDFYVYFFLMHPLRLILNATSSMKPVTISTHTDSSGKQELPKWFTYHQFTLKIHHVVE